MPRLPGSLTCLSWKQRGLGLSKWLMEVVVTHPDLQGFRRWVLATKDAHDLYRRFGFHELKRPERWMERPDPNMHESPDYWKETSVGLRKTSAGF